MHLAVRTSSFPTHAVRCLAASTLLGLVALRPARAQSGSDAAAAAEPAEFEATAQAESPIAAGNRVDPTASGTTIELRNRGRALEDVAEALIEVPGVRVLDAGGAGAAVGVSLRGAELGHTSVMLGAIPLDTPDGSAFDLSVLPMSAFESVEVYRGGAPAWYGAGAIGGVLRFVPTRADTDELQATGGAGSYGRAELRTTGQAAGSGPVRPAFLGHVRLLRADNDYAYVDDGQTRFDSSDDRELHQQNADILAGDSLLHANLDVLGGRLTFLFLSHGRLQGIPGPLAAPTHHVRRNLVRILGGVSYETQALRPDGERRYAVQAVASGSHQANRVTDLYGEIGTAGNLDTDDVWQRAYARAGSAFGLSSWFEPSLMLEFSADGYSPNNLAAFSAPPRPSQRFTEAVTLETRVHGRLFGARAELRPSVRAAFSQTSIHPEGAPASASSDSDAQVAPTYRVAGVLEPVRALALSASVASGTRLPSIGELFGDRALQDPNTRLSPEHSTGVDLGAVLRGRAGPLSGQLEARGYLLWIDDLIRYERTSQYTVRPENVASARIYGGELGLGGQLGRHFNLASSLTVMETRNQFGKALPLRPPFQVLVRPETHWFPGFADEFVVFGEVHHVAFVYLDEANLSYLPPRTVLALGGSISLWSERVTLEARVNNLLDTSMTDVLSRPLPGRELRVALTLRERP